MLFRVLLFKGIRTKASEIRAAKHLEFEIVLLELSVDIKFDQIQNQLRRYMSSVKSDLLNWSLVGLLYLISISGISQQPVELMDSNGGLINQHILVYHSPDTLTGNQAWEQIQSKNIPTTSLNINPGMSFPLDSYWIVFQLKNTSNLKDYILEIDYPQMDFIELFEVNDTEVTKLHTTGDNFPFIQRPIDARNFALPIKVDPNKSETYLLHLRKIKSTIRFPIYVHTESSYTAKHFNTNFWYSIYFGFILLVAIMAVVVGFIIKNNTFKIYSIYVIAFAFWLFTRLGYSYQFFFPNAIEFNRHLLSACGQLAMMGLVLYVMSFFNTKKSLPKFHKVMSVILLFFLVNYITWSLFPEQFVHYATKLFPIRYALFTTIIVFAFTAAIHTRKVNRFKSTMFLFAYSTFLLAIIGKILMDYGVFNEMALGFDPILLGYLIEVIILSITMSIMLKRHVEKSTEIVNAHEKLKEQLGREEQNDSKGYIKLTSKAVIPSHKISHIKSDDHYLEFYLIDGTKEVDRNKLTEVLETLPANFIQTHRSFAINLDQIKVMFAEKIEMQNGSEVKLSRTYKKKFQEQLKLD